MLPLFSCIKTKRSHYSNTLFNNLKKSIQNNGAGINIYLWCIYISIAARHWDSFKKRYRENIRKSIFGNFNGGMHLQVLGV
jgi:hypothetical protein